MDSTESEWLIGEENHIYTYNLQTADLSFKLLNQNNWENNIFLSNLKKGNVLLFPKRKIKSSFNSILTSIIVTNHNLEI